MRNISQDKSTEYALRQGILDARSELGEAARSDFRILLNVDVSKERGRARMGGWSAWRSDDYSNEDLHDQLITGEESAQNEAITTMTEATSNNGSNYLIACTNSRIYASTGSAKNFRILADELGPNYSPGMSQWGNARIKTAQMGDYVLFTNGVNNVLAWPVGGATITEGENAAREWAAFEVYDLLGLKILRAGCIAAWGGFVFLGDVNVEGEQQSARVYWSDFNKPLEWAPGGESAAGYTDFGKGERVLLMAPIGGGLRCYTDRAIYAVELIGGDAVFLFREIYRGDMAVAYENSFVNLGDTHCWLTQNTMVVLGEYDKSPREVEWMRKAAGFIFDGLDDRLLKGWPGEFEGFLPLDAEKCHQIAAGYDGKLQNMWISWPTQRVSLAQPDDGNDFEDTKRMTLVFSTRYQRATLVDHGFSAFASSRIKHWDTVRDFLTENGAGECDESTLDPREGAPLNEVESPEDPPDYIWNEDEDPDEPMGEDGLAARVCDIDLSAECKACVGEPDFAMASARDFCIKMFTPDTYNREVFVEPGDVYIPEDVDEFPNVAQGEYEIEGYPFLIQSECNQLGANEEKTVRRIAVEFDPDEQAVPGQLECQLGISNSQRCIDWFNASAVDLDCNRGTVSDETQAGVARPSRPASFAFYRTGSWIAYRLFVSFTEDEEKTYSPTGCAASFSSVLINHKQKNETWANQ